MSNDGCFVTITGWFSLQFGRVTIQIQAAPPVWPLMTSPFVASQHTSEADLNWMALKRDIMAGQKVNRTQWSGHSS